MAEVNAITANLFGIVRGIALGVAVLFIAIGAMQYITAGGNPQQVQQGKTTMMNACVGFGLILAATVIANVVRVGHPVTREVRFCLAAAALAGGFAAACFSPVRHRC